MALIGALLLTIVLSTALGGLAMIAAIERRTAAAHALGVQLRLAGQGALAMAAGELATVDWNAALGGVGVSEWRRPLVPPLDLTALAQSLQRATMMESSHGADTPVWRLFAHMPWAAASGQPGPSQTVVWIADDWADGDADPARDQNGLVLVRVMAAAGVATSWAEALCARGEDGRVEIRHVRSW
jgi:hypothetical protein